MQLYTFPAANGFKEHDVLDPRFGRLRIAFAVPSTVTGVFKLHWEERP